MVWKLTIKKVDNGFVVADGENITTVIQEEESTTDGDKAEAMLMVDLLYFVKEHFLPQRRKYNKNFIEIKIVECD